MQQRALAEPTSWRFYAGIHGFNPALWQQLGYFSPTDPLPSSAARQAVLAAVPARQLVLPAMAPGLPARLGGEHPGGRGRARRPGRLGVAVLELLQAERVGAPTGLRLAGLAGRRGRQPALRRATLRPQRRRRRVRAAPTRSNLNALGDPDFTGVSSGGSPGFGGVDTGLLAQRVGARWHRDPAARLGARPGGRLRTSNDQSQPARCRYPTSAGARPDLLAAPRQHRPALGVLEPLAPPPHLDPYRPELARGPGQRRRARLLRCRCRTAAPGPTPPAEMRDIQQLGYEYDDLTPAGRPRLRLRTGWPGCGVRGSPAQRRQKKCRPCQLRPTSNSSAPTTEAVPIVGSEVRSGSPARPRAATKGGSQPVPAARR